MRIESMSANLFAELTAGNRVGIGGGDKTLVELAQTQLVRLEIQAQEKPMELQDVEKSEFDPFERLRKMFQEDEDAYLRAMEWMDKGYQTLQDRISSLKEQLLDEALNELQRERLEEQLIEAQTEMSEFEAQMEKWKATLNQSFDESVEELTALFAILKAKMAEGSGGAVTLKELLDMRAEARLELLEATQKNLETRNQLREERVLASGEDSVTRQADRLAQLEERQAAAKRGDTEPPREDSFAGVRFEMVLAKVDKFVREAVDKLNAPAQRPPEAEMDVQA